MACTCVVRPVAVRSKQQPTLLHDYPWRFYLPRLFRILSERVCGVVASMLGFTTSSCRCTRKVQSGDGGGGCWNARNALSLIRADAGQTTLALRRSASPARQVERAQCLSSATLDFPHLGNARSNTGS